MNPTFDDKDAELLATRRQAWDKREGPRVGDFIEMTDGTLRRFTHAWDDGLQTTMPQFGLGSFYLDCSGHGDYSGSLDHVVPFEQIEPTDRTEKGRFWFFHHDHATAHNGVDVTLPCRVFRQRSSL